MSTINDGGPAFPVGAVTNFNGDIVRYAEDGMSLRAYIAVHRPAPNNMTVDFASDLTRRPLPDRAAYGDGVSGPDYWLDCRRWWAEASAVYSVMQADALIAELAKVKP